MLSSFQLWRRQQEVLLPLQRGGPRSSRAQLLRRRAVVTQPRSVLLLPRVRSDAGQDGAEEGGGGDQEDAGEVDEVCALQSRNLYFSFRVNL